jgi:hypothetical protein
MIHKAFTHSKAFKSVFMSQTIQRESARAIKVEACRAMNVERERKQSRAMPTTISVCLSTPSVTCTLSGNLNNAVFLSNYMICFNILVWVVTYPTNPKLSKLRIQNNFFPLLGKKILRKKSFCKIRFARPSVFLEYFA